MFLLLLLAFGTISKTKLPNALLALLASGSVVCIHCPSMVSLPEHSAHPPGSVRRGPGESHGAPCGEVRLKGARCSPRCRSRGDGPLEVKGYVPVGKERGKGVARVLPGVRVPQHHYCAPLPSALMVAGGNGLGRKGRLCVRSLLSGSSSCSLSAA